MELVEELHQWLYKKLTFHASENLKKNGFTVSIFNTSVEAKQYILKQCEKADSIGFGGSQSVASMKIYDELKGKTLLDHGIKSLTTEEKQSIRIKQQSCDLFLTSTNALTLDGKVVNIDGTGNRVNAMAFGPKKVLIVAGVNKIVKDTESALKRIKEYAAPMNAKRLGCNTPCAQTGLCNECSSPERICNITTILEKKPHHTDIEVVLVCEPLGL